MQGCLLLSLFAMIIPRFFVLDGSCWFICLLLGRCCFTEYLLFVLIGLGMSVCAMPFVRYRRRLLRGRFVGCVWGIRAFFRLCMYFCRRGGWLSVWVITTVNFNPLPRSSAWKDWWPWLHLSVWPPAQHVPDVQSWERAWATAKIRSEDCFSDFASKTLFSAV